MTQFQVVGTNIILNGVQACADYVNKHNEDALKSLCKKVVSYSAGDPTQPIPWTSKVYFRYVIQFIHTLTQKEKELFLNLLWADADQHGYYYSDDFGFTKGDVSVWLARNNLGSQWRGYFQVPHFMLCSLSQTLTAVLP